MNITSDFPIYKISNSVFQIGDINYDQKFINIITSLLTLGNKFVPNYFSSNTQFLHFLLLDIDLKLIDFNKRIFFSSKNNKINTLDTNNKNTTNSRISSNLLGYKLNDIFFDDLFKFLNKKNLIRINNNRKIIMGYLKII